jgi:hypothetical protein
MTAITLGLADTLLDAPLPDQMRRWVSQDSVARDMIDRLARDIFQREVRPAEVKIFPWNSECYQAVPRWSDRRRLIIDQLLLPTVHEWTLCPLPRWLSGAYWIIRPTRLVYRWCRTGARR